MCCNEYNMPFYINSYVGEGNDEDQWMIQSRNAISLEDGSLEAEIQLLRNRMEKLFLQEQSFTSDIVIEISSLLDLKINEYMKSNKQK